MTWSYDIEKKQLIHSGDTWDGYREERWNNASVLQLLSVLIMAGLIVVNLPKE